MHRKVRDPKTLEVLRDSAPKTVEASSYWLRLLKMGDVVLVETAQEEISVGKKQKQKKAKAELTSEEM